MNNLWVDPQLPYELEDAFLTYGTPFFAMRGETILKMDERNDHFYFIADGLVAVLSKSSATSGVFLANIVPESRAFGFTCYPYVGLKTYELKVLRDTAIYSIPHTTIYNMLHNGYINRWVFRKYQRSVKYLEHMAANTLIATHSSDRIMASVKSFNLADIKYDSYWLTKGLKLNDSDMKEILLTKAAYEDIYRDKPLHSKVTSVNSVKLSYVETHKLTDN